MIEITITREGEVTNRAFKVNQAEAEAWVASCERDYAFGRPAGYYRLPDGVDSNLETYTTYDGKWVIALKDIQWFEGKFDESYVVPQVWAQCIAEYEITYTDLEHDQVYINTQKTILLSRVNKEVDRVVGAVYSMSEMIMYAMIDGNLPDQFLEIKGTIQAAYADADPIIRRINECTTQSEVDALLGLRFTILGEPACL